ncbi:uncharacterized protein LOC128854950 [Anastrepha ludens]|uniref:uncharacterized protein LOC128854950 n=1 Tax=Anastrepha ludens TaxID=28586 RepID=UPI0023AEED46|nr:uncharacterized protein LOC128854950 [Anastrepha ludens]
MCNPIFLFTIFCCGYFTWNMETLEDVKYIPHKSKADDKSSVWYYFLVSACGGPTAQCKSCNKVLKTCFGSTKGLLTHLKYHKIELERKPGKPTMKKLPKIPPLKPKYEIIDGKIAPTSPTRSNNSSTGFDGDISNLYEKQIEFVDGYLGENPFINEDSDHTFEPKPPKIFKRENPYQRNKTLEDLRTRVEIQLMRAKTTYFTKQMENLDIERSVMLLKAKKLELEVEKLRNEAHGSILPTEKQ